MPLSSTAIIDRAWHNFLRAFSGNDHIVEYYIFTEAGDGDGYDDRQVALSPTEIAQARHAFK